ncbi:MAG: Holliday junction resolvase RuvX [Simkaniaceae bacterium]|nr:Holliday junction resolvase RuvX [Simkaniaceae bacterium]MCF7853119.1 Holliday junction resolvase RuvX [Simkaniaceae bacterium]
MSRIFAIDYGRKRIGIACTDDSKIIASPYKTIEAKKTMQLSIEHLIETVKAKGDIELFVIGLPLHMSGQESEMSREVREFGALLESASGKKVVYWDERLTSMLVNNTMRDANVNRKDRAEAKDYLSASVLLQSYLEAHRG